MAEATYEDALAAGRKTGARRCTDSENMAMLLDTSGQIILGAVSPKLIWDGALARGLMTLQLASLMTEHPDQARDLMWGE